MKVIDWSLSDFSFSKKGSTMHTQQQQQMEKVFCIGLLTTLFHLKINVCLKRITQEELQSRKKLCERRIQSLLQAALASHNFIVWSNSRWAVTYRRRKKCLFFLSQRKMAFTRYTFCWLAYTWKLEIALLSLKTLPHLITLSIWHGNLLVFPILSCEIMIWC